MFSKHEKPSKRRRPGRLHECPRFCESRLGRNTRSSKSRLDRVVEPETSKRSRALPRVVDQFQVFLLGCGSRTCRRSASIACARNCCSACQAAQHQVRDVLSANSGSVVGRERLSPESTRRRQIAAEWRRWRATKRGGSQARIPDQDESTASGSIARCVGLRKFGIMG